MSFPFGKTVTIISQTVDNFGNRTPDDSTEVGGCATWETLGTELLGHQDTVTWDVTLLVPAQVDIRSTDRITVDGVTYEVVSQPIELQSVLTGWRPGIEVHLRKVTG